MNNNKPKDWGQDHFSEFADRARAHEYETIAALPEQYRLIVRVDSLFKQVQENLAFTKEWFAAMFFLRTHSTFLCAANAALSGQLPESYMLLRGSLENALYGIYLSHNKKHAKTWLERNESPQAKKKVRDQFKNATLITFLGTLDRGLARAADTLYERCIDFGAHPNQLGLTTAMRIEEGDPHPLLKMAYLSGEPASVQLCLKTTHQVGVFALAAFRYVFKERFDILGITEEIEKLKANI